MDWAEVPFIEYLNAVDAVLEKLKRRASEQGDLDLIAAAQENNLHPEEAAAEDLHRNVS